MNDRLYRSRDDRMLAGVAGGLAELWDADPSLVRIVWALLIFLTGGIALIVYIIMAIVVPDEDDVWPPVATATAGPGDTAPDSSAAAAPGAMWAASPADSRRQARREARAARRAAGGDRGGVPGTVIGGAILILIGAWFLLQEFLPQFDFDVFWPLLLVGIGVAMLVVALGSGRGKGGAA